MIASRTAFLLAIKRARITPRGIVVGPLAFVGGKYLHIRRVYSETARKRLIDAITRADASSFGMRDWEEIPC